MPKCNFCQKDFKNGLVIEEKLICVDCIKSVLNEVEKYAEKLKEESKKAWSGTTDTQYDF